MARNRCAGWTLIEALVAVGVVGLLLSLLVPVLAGARGNARQTVCLANLKTAAAAFEAYGREYRDTYPFTAAGEPLLIGPPDVGGWVNDPSPWMLVYYWPSLMHDVAPWRAYFGSWVCPGSPRTPGAPWTFEGDLPIKGLPSYRYARAFQADPGAFAEGAIADPMLLRGVRFSEVAHPSQKVLLFDGEMAHAGRVPVQGHDARPMLFADAHAAVRKVSQAHPPALNPFLGDGEALHDTPDGVRGYDYD